MEVFVSHLSNKSSQCLMIVVFFHMIIETFYLTALCWVNDNTKPLKDIMTNQFLSF